MKDILNRYMTLSREVKSSLWYTLCNLVQKGIGFVVVPILTRLLTTSEYGLYNIFLSWIQIFEIIATLRLSWGSYIVGLTKFRDDRDRYTSSLQSLSLVIITITFIIYLLNSRFLNNLLGISDGMILLIFATLYTMPAIGFFSSRQKVELKYKKMVVVTLFITAFVPILGIYFILNMDENKYEGMIYSRIIIQAFISLIIMYIFYKTKPVFFIKKYWSNALKINIPLIPYYYAMVLLLTVDKIMIGSLIGNSEAGIYSVAFSMGMVMQLFNSSLNSTIQPWLFKKLNDKNYKGISTNINISLCGIAVINLFLIALAPELVKIMAPVEYYDAIWIIPPIAASVVIMFTYQHFINIEFYFEASKNISLASIVAIIIKIALNFILLPILGYLSAGYTTIISYLVFAVIHYYFMLKICEQNHCYAKLVNIRITLLIIAIFFIMSIVLSIGYIFFIIRYIVLLLFIIIICLKRNEIYIFYRNLK